VTKEKKYTPLQYIESGEADETTSQIIIRKVILLELFFLRVLPAFISKNINLSMMHTPKTIRTIFLMITLTLPVYLFLYVEMDRQEQIKIVKDNKKREVLNCYRVNTIEKANTLRRKGLGCRI